MLSLLIVTIERIHPIFAPSYVFSLRFYLLNKPHMFWSITTSVAPQKEFQRIQKKHQHFFFSFRNLPSTSDCMVVILLWLMPTACQWFILLTRLCLFLKQTDFSAFDSIVGSANACICSIGVNIMLRNDHF